ncbi:MAG: hypothetical protein GY715_00780, partial [Planctomycetes bacterium]|nr:hypothetical protein [Planctomycetota bacterium]
MERPVARSDRKEYRTLTSAPSAAARLILALITMLALCLGGTVRAQDDVTGTNRKLGQEPTGTALGQLHGVTIAKTCAGPKKPGETLDCEIIVGHNDDFGDTLEIQDVFNVIRPGPGEIVVAEFIICAADGNTTAVVGGTLPVRIGPPGSVLGGLPGNPLPGVVTFRQNTYVIEEDDPSPLPSQANVLVQDLCDHPDTAGCSQIPSLVQFVAATPLAKLTFEKTASDDVICENGEVTYTYVVDNVGDVFFQDVEVVDDSCGPVQGPSGDVNGDGLLNAAELFVDLNGNGVWDALPFPEPLIDQNGNGIWDDVETWTYTCTTILTETTTNTATVTGFVPQGPDPVNPDCLGAGGGFFCVAQAQATVTVLPAPVADPAPAVACQGETAEICANASEGLPPYTYSWTGPGGFTSTEECIDVGVAGDYCVIVTDANNCDSVEACATLTINPLPPCSIDGPADRCVGTTGTYTGPAGMAAYQWSTIGDCGTIIGSTTNPSVQIQFPTVGTCTVQLTIVDTNGCVNTCEFPVTVNPPPVCDIAGPPVRCEGEAGTYTGPAGMASYQWSTLGDCGTIVGPSTNPSVQIQFPTPGICRVQLTIVDTNGCLNTCEFPVTVNPLPVCDIDGPPALCEDATGTYTGPAGMASYQWSTLGGCGTIVGPSTNPSVQIQFPTPG